MRPLNLPSDRPALDFRFEQLKLHGRYAYDLVVSHWKCPQCGTPIPGVEPMGVPLVTYRNVEDLKANLLNAGEAAAANAELPTCPQCNRVGVLTRLEHHVYLEAEKRDLVARWEPDSDKPPSLWFWSRDHDYIPIVALSPEQQAAFTRDALLRAIAAFRDFDEAEAAFAVLEEALQIIPGESELLRFVPWLNSRQKYSLSGPIAQTHVETHPDDPRGHFWLGQVYLELVASRTWSTDALPKAVAAFEQALQLSPNHDYPDALLGIVNVQRTLGKNEAALELLDRLLNRTPDHPEALYTKGLLLLDIDPQGALLCFEQGAALRPDDPDYPKGIERAKRALGGRKEG